MINVKNIKKKEVYNMKKNGFTLIELLGVVVILALIMLIIFPSVINTIKKSSDATDEATLNLIYNASDLYISNHPRDFKKIDGNTYIIYLSNMVAEDLLSSPIKLSGSEDITNTKCVSATYQSGFSYELINCPTE